MQDIYNVRKTVPYLENLDPRRSVEDNVIEVLHWDSIVAFNLRLVFIRVDPG